MYGKMLRMSRLINPRSGKICIIPIDHGATYGPIEGITDYIKTVESINAGRADAIVLHKGLLREVAKHPTLGNGKYIVHLSASTCQGSKPEQKVLVSSVEEAIKLGADGVSMHVNLGVVNEGDMIKDLGIVSGECIKWGIPLLVMIYTFKEPRNFRDIVHAARLAEEMGADIVKVSYPGTIDKMAKITEGVRIPVVIAGGNKMDTPQALLYMIGDALSGGAAGVAVGRNIFQANNPSLTTRLISKLIHGEINLLESINELDKIENYKHKDMVV